MHLALVLHSHLPWLRRNGTYPVGEEWLFQSWAESYLPLLEMLERLAEGGARDLLTVGITPVLAEQMDDAYLLREFHGWLGRRLIDLEFTISRYDGSDRHRLEAVWSHHWRTWRRLLERYESRERSTGFAASFRALADAGVIELLGGPATHPYLPLMDDAALIRAQVDVGLAVHERHFGARPSGVWTPECGYRPAGSVADPTRPPLETRADGTPHLQRSQRELDGLETFWSDAGATHFVVDGPTLARAAGVPERDWAAVGGILPDAGGPLDAVDHPARVGDTELVAFGRNLPVTYAVWSPQGGYPADAWYRDFHRVDQQGGFKSWRVTNRDSWDKAPYDPMQARERAVAHAADFVGLLHRYLDRRPRSAIVVAAFDTELFGHWWYEGPLWLETTLRRLLEDPRLEPVTLRGYLEQHPAEERLVLPESSWGWGKGHGAWVSEQTRWIWQAVRDAERRFGALPADAPGRDLAWRQLALLQSSDWPFLVARDQAAQYATERVRAHLERFDAACRGERLPESAVLDDPWGTLAPPARSRLDG